MLKFLGVKVEEETFKKLENIKEKHGITKSEVIRMLFRFIDDEVILAKGNRMGVGERRVWEAL